MDEEYIMDHLLLLIAGLIILGIGIGLAAGLFGTGGGTILVPLLLVMFTNMGYSHFNDIHIAIGTSLALVVPTTLSSSYSHYRLSHLDINIAIRWIPGICIGVFIGVLLFHLIPSPVLKCIFAGYLVFCIIHSLFKKNSTQKEKESITAFILLPLSIVVGTLSTMLGIGGGTFTTPILRFLRYPLTHALAISSLTSLFIGSIGVSSILYTTYHLTDLPLYTLGYVNWLVFVCISPMTAIFSSVGVKLQSKLTKGQLDKGYTGFLSFILCVLLYHMTHLFI